jgi:hypothetical protein
MTRTLTVEGTGSRRLVAADLEPLLAPGADGKVQASRLARVSLLVRDRGRLVGAAACRHGGADFCVDELAILPADSDDLADDMLDLLETVAIAGGYGRIGVCSTSRSLRRAIRLLGYMPQRLGKRVCFVRILTTLPEIRQSAMKPMRQMRANRSQ